jgi:hypothetical protein
MNPVTRIEADKKMAFRIEASRTFIGDGNDYFSVEIGPDILLRCVQFGKMSRIWK